jgi:hypothetical protein
MSNLSWTRFTAAVLATGCCVTLVGAQAPAPPPPDVRTEPPKTAPKAAPPKAVEELDRIIIEDVLDPEDARKRDKAAIGKMRDSLDKVASKRGLSARETVANDGARRAELNVNGSLFCLESRAGQIDWSGLNKGGTATKPSGNSCP